MESLVASRLIPIKYMVRASTNGVEVLRRTAGKAVMILLKKDVTQAGDSLKLNLQGKLPELKPQNTLCKIFSRIITQKVFH